MAQRVEVTHVDDLDGSAADETVRFGLDGTEYEIDLSAGHAAGLRGELERFTSAARRKPGQSRRRKRSARPDLPEIREFARVRGYDIKERGAVPGRIIEEYDTLKRISAT